MQSAMMCAAAIYDYYLVDLMLMNHSKKSESKDLIERCMHFQRFASMTMYFSSIF